MTKISSESPSELSLPLKVYQSGKERARETGLLALAVLLSDTNLLSNFLSEKKSLFKKSYEKLSILLSELLSDKESISDLLSDRNLLYEKLSKKLLSKLFTNKFDLLSDKNLLYVELLSEKEPLSDEKLSERLLFELLYDKKLLSELLPEKLLYEELLSREKLLSQKKSLSGKKLSKKLSKNLFENLLSKLLPKQLSSEEELSKILGSESSKEKTERISKKYKLRTKKSLFGDHRYFPDEVRNKREIERKKGIQEPNFVTEFLRGERAYYDNEKGEVLCHPINLATPYLIDMQKFFERIVNAGENKIYILIATRHGEKLSMDGGLSSNGVNQAINLGKKLKDNMKEEKENEKNEDNKDNTFLFFFGHNTIFESILMTLYFGNKSEDLLNIKDEKLIDNRNNIENFPHNDIDYKKHDNYKDKISEYTNQDWTKMLEYTESVNFVFYPHPKNGEPYMKIKFRGIEEKITYSQFNKIVDKLKDSKFDLWKDTQKKNS